MIFSGIEHNVLRICEVARRDAEQFGRRPNGRSRVLADIGSAHNQLKTEMRTIFFQPAFFILLGTACKCKPSASIIFKTVESSGFPDGD